MAKKKYPKAKTYPILRKAKKGVKYISAPEVAKRLKVSLPTVYGWIQRCLFKGITKNGGGRWMIPSVGLKKPIVPDWHFSSPKTKRQRADLRRKSNKRLSRAVTTNPLG